MLVPGSWKVEEPPRFAEKLSVGALKYQDFNPFESAQSSSYLTGGYGLRRYSDLDTTSNQYSQMTAVSQAVSMYSEAHNVDARFGPITLSALQSVETLPGSTSPPVWSGEFTPSGGSRTWVIVTQNKVYTRAGGGVWSDTGIVLPAVAVRGAVGVFGGRLLIGFGAAHTAIYTTDLSTTSNVVNDAGAPAPLYAFAYTSDQAAAFIAGGTASTDVHKVMASPDGSTFQVASITVCGGSNSKITALSPGGGLGLLFVGKETELGTIDSSAAIYRILVPFDSSLDSNCTGMRWWMGSGDNEQRGPLILVFPRDRSIWAYEPSSQTAGRAQNVSPWAQPQLRPPTVRGKITALQGTARWLYFAITNSAGESWLAARDAETGANHGALLDLGVGASTQMLGITSLFGSPMLFAGVGNNVISVVLPLDGEVPFDDPNCTFVGSGTIDLPDMDLGFPDEDKVLLHMRVTADGLQAGAQYIKVYVNYDGGPWTPLGIAETSPFVEISFDPDIVAKRVGVRLKLITTSPALTPKLLGVSLRVSINTRLYRQWSFSAIMPPGTSPSLSDMLSSPYADIRTLWDTREAGVPVIFIDRWNDIWKVRIRQIAEREVYREVDHVPESAIDVQLLQVAAGQDVSASFVAPTGSVPFFPLSFPWTPLYSSVMNSSQTVLIQVGGGMPYPRWVITGPGLRPVLTGPLGEVFTLDYELAAGEIVTINMAPTRKTVISSSVGDISDRVVVNSLFWQLQNGSNTVTIAMGRTSAVTQATMTWDSLTTY